MDEQILFKKIISYIPDKHNIANHTLERLRVEDSNRPNGTLHYTFRTQPYHPNLNIKKKNYNLKSLDDFTNILRCKIFQIFLITCLIKYSVLTTLKQTLQWSSPARAPSFVISSRTPLVVRNWSAKNPSISIRAAIKSFEERPFSSASSVSCLILEQTGYSGNFSKMLKGSA